MDRQFARVKNRPGSELRDYFGSEAADQAGSDNVIGIKNPAVDATIERIVLAKSYDDLAAAAKALDRILLWNNYVVPQWSFNKLDERAAGRASGCRGRHQEARRMKADRRSRA